MGSANGFRMDGSHMSYPICGLPRWVPHNSPIKKKEMISTYEVHFYVRRIGLYLYKYKIYGTISIYILKGPASVYQLNKLYIISA